MNDDLETKWNDYDSDTLYLISKDKDRLIVIKEGDGSNLLPEDESQGYKDYWYVTEYDLEEMVEDDGMQWLETELITDINYTIEDVIKRNGYSLDYYLVLDNIFGEELQEILDDLDMLIHRYKQVFEMVSTEVNKNV